MTKTEFIELVYNYGASERHAFEGLNLKPMQEEDVVQAWSEFDADDSKQETDEKFGNYYKGFLLSGKWFVNFCRIDLDGYFNGQGGTIDYEGKGFCNSLEYALSFDSEAEAKAWVEEHKEEWGRGEFSIW